MTWIPLNPRLGLQPIAVTSTVQNHQLGDIITAYDSTGVQGGGEFIYLKGVGSTVVGSLVTYDTVGATTTLAPATASLNNPLAVAMSANIATQFGWYQIAGAAFIAKTAVKINPAVKLFLAGSGQVNNTSVAGKQVFNAKTVNAATVASATGTVLALINRPFAEAIAT